MVSGPFFSIYCLSTIYCHLLYILFSVHFVTLQSEYSTSYKESFKFLTVDDDFSYSDFS